MKTSSLAREEPEFLMSFFRSCLRTLIIRIIYPENCCDLQFVYMNFMFSLYHIHIINAAWVINKSFSSFFGRKMRIRKSQLVLVFQLHEMETKITTSPLTSTTITEILVALLVQPTQ